MSPMRQMIIAYAVCIAALVVMIRWQSFAVAHEAAILSTLTAATVAVALNWWIVSTIGWSMLALRALRPMLFWAVMGLLVFFTSVLFHGSQARTQFIFVGNGLALVAGIVIDTILNRRGYAAGWM